MYCPAAFAEDDPDRLAALIRARPLASLVVHGAGGLVVAHAPMMVEQDAAGRITALTGHLARANPFWSGLSPEHEALAIFTGPDAYVSPSMYPSKRAHGKVVPTWNYARIEARGHLTVETDPAAIRPYIEDLTTTLERDRAEPWGLDDAPAGYVEKLQHAIVGLRIKVTAIGGALKLSQNRNPEDYAGVRDALGASANLSDRAVSEMMSPNARLD